GRSFPFEAHEPVQAIGVLALVLHALPGDAAGARRRDNDVVAGTPVGRGSDVFGVGLLQGLDNPLDLIEVAPGAQGIIEYRPDYALRVDDEYGPDRLGVGLAGLDHPVLP